MNTPLLLSTPSTSEQPLTEGRWESIEQNINLQAQDIARNLGLDEEKLSSDKAYIDEHAPLIRKELSKIFPKHILEIGIKRLSDPQAQCPILCALLSQDGYRYRSLDPQRLSE